MKYYELNDQTSVPAIGFGTYRIESGPEAIRGAIELGYELIDTAWIYGNEALVGEAIRGLAPERRPLVATKVWPNHFTRELTRRSVERSLELLGLEQIDIVYTHWDGEKLAEAWRELERCQEEGLIRTLGVSNLTRRQLERLSLTANVQPALDQIEIQPLWAEVELVDYLLDEGIRPVAYSPFDRMRDGVRNSPVLLEMAERYEKSLAQIILRWHIERGIIPIPKAISASRQEENLRVFDFALEPQDVAAINALSRPDGKHCDACEDQAWLDEIARMPL